MEKKIYNVDAFNDLFFRGCFYNSFFPIVIYFNKSILPFLYNEVVYYENFGQFGISGKFETIHQFEKIVTNMGLDMEKRRESHSIVSDIITTLKNEGMAIVWVDCYYLPMRVDSFKIEHWEHTILVHGFDQERRVFNIIEHKYRDNLTYGRYEISFDDLERAYEGYISNFSVLNRYSFFQFKKNKNHFNYKESKADLPGYLDDFLQEITLKEQKILASLEYVNDFKKKLLQINYSLEHSFKIVEESLTPLNGIIHMKKLEQYRSSHLSYCLNSTVVNHGSELTEHWIAIRIMLTKYVLTKKNNAVNIELMSKRLERIVELEKDILKCYIFSMK